MEEKGENINGEHDKQEYQNIIVKLSDGSTHIFTGKVMARKGDTRTISSVLFSKPAPLPSGHYFEQKGG